MINHIIINFITKRGFYENTYSIDLGSAGSRCYNCFLCSVRDELSLKGVKNV